MKKVFADADYLIALLNPRENLHDQARTVSERVGRTRLLTSQMVLAEVLAFYADKGAAMREAAATLASRLSSDPNVTVIPQTSVQFQEALYFYRQRDDKEWSLTDCASFLIMHDAGISEAFTHDHHFEQAGFTALLRDSQ
jgi:predicted nucleic acid-binding protein